MDYKSPLFKDDLCRQIAECLNYPPGFYSAMPSSDRWPNNLAVALTLPIPLDCTWEIKYTHGYLAKARLIQHNTAGGSDYVLGECNPDDSDLAMAVCVAWLGAKKKGYI